MPALPGPWSGTAQCSLSAVVAPARGARSCPSDETWLRDADGSCLAHALRWSCDTFASHSRCRPYAHKDLDGSLHFFAVRVRTYARTAPTRGHAATPTTTHNPLVRSSNKYGGESERKQQRLHTSAAEWIQQRTKRRGSTEARLLVCRGRRYPERGRAETDSRLPFATSSLLPYLTLSIVSLSLCCKNVCVCLRVAGEGGIHVCVYVCRPLLYLNRSPPLSTSVS